MVECQISLRPPQKAGFRWWVHRQSVPNPRQLFGSVDKNRRCRVRKPSWHTSVSQSESQGYAHGSARSAQNRYLAWFSPLMHVSSRLESSDHRPEDLKTACQAQAHPLLHQSGFA
ncbi:Uncharacterised protein [Vibrio cholerae]|nr:Uncharacterised protein [Vibrio cholerae]